MYKIDKASNSLQPLEKKSLTDLGFYERDHLQEWIAKLPSVLGEELLIIQKGFSGFEDTREELDLLALDKSGALVIIENKRDDSGRDVTWQALKYTSYCSGLSKANITKIFQQYLDVTDPGANAEERLSEFMEGQDVDELVLNAGISQRIILVATKFRKEVTSTVLYLMNFKLRIQCIRVTPFAMGDELFLTAEQIIPTQDAEEYMISMAEKAQSDSESQAQLQTMSSIRKRFWTQLLPVMNATSSTLFQNVNPRKNTWIAAGAGKNRVRFSFRVSTHFGRAELYIDRTKEDNDFIFDQLYNIKDQIENTFGEPLEWEKRDDRKANCIKAERPGNVADSDQWDGMIFFLKIKYAVAD